MLVVLEVPMLVVAGPCVLVGVPWSLADRRLRPFTCLARLSIGRIHTPPNPWSSIACESCSPVE